MADSWKTTADLFSKLIDKPKMTEKLLKRPPPKYVYEIILNTQKVTGFPKGLLTDKEEDPKAYEKLETKEKAEIFQKVIDITKIVLNEAFEIKSTDILKGVECDKTNYFLQCFHKAATNGKDKSEFIKKYLSHKNKKKEEPQSKKKEEPQREKPKESSKPKESQGGKKPTGIISEKDDNFDKEMEAADDGSNTKMKSGTGMKLDTHIFMHNDVMSDRKDGGKHIVSNVDLGGIKTHVQEITKNVNPIGKIVEFLGDDVDLMNKELHSWIKESQSYKDRYDEEIKKSDETLLPLQNELLELEDAIRDEQMQIKSIKSRLIRNEKIIYNLITNVISFKGDQTEL
ncbi:MAG: hypothetical protein MJ252_30830 [archaeon]|nr:hypothetical protein [archaeon]